MKSPFPLDDAPGPALPIDEAKAQLMIARALEMAGPRQVLPPPSRRSVVRRLAMAAGLFVALSGSAWAAWQVGLGTGLSALFGSAAPKPEPTSTEARSDEDVPSVEPLAEPAAATPPIDTSPSDGPVPLGPEAREDLEGSEPAAADDDAASPPTTRARPPRRSASPVRPKPVDLLAEANHRRRMGEWQRAEGLYLQAARRAASPSIRQTAWVAVGELRLESMAQPRQAVAAFRRSLRHAGPLEAEALWGLARALRASGEEAQAKDVARKLLERFPTRPESKRAQEWLRL
ncbi:MAG: hypothetical protein AAF627_20865 [Myxococcota bacterium]